MHKVGSRRKHPSPYLILLKDGGDVIEFFTCMSVLSAGHTQEAESLAFSFF